MIYLRDSKAMKCRDLQQLCINWWNRSNKVSTFFCDIWNFNSINLNFLTIGLIIFIIFKKEDSKKSKVPQITDCDENLKSINKTPQDGFIWSELLHTLRSKHAPKPEQNKLKSKLLAESLNKNDNSYF